MLKSNKWLLAGISATLISATTMWEGTRYYAYHDIVGVPTVCQGYTGPGIIFGKKYSEAECSAFLKKDILEHSNGMLECVKVPLSENEFNAYSLLTYNIGVKAFCGSTAAKRLNAGDRAGACDAILFWKYAGGQVVRGLENRRKYERELCLRGLNS